MKHTGRAFGVVAAVVVYCLCGLEGPAHAQDPAGESHLCPVLESIADGQIRRVTVSGVYQSSFEGSVLADPEQPVCALDVQPVTWVEFTAGLAPNADLDRLIKAEGRAMVTFEGQLHGPGPLRPDDVRLPWASSLVFRTSGRGYGHMGAYRTRLVVEGVHAVAPVARDLPWFWGVRPACKLDSPRVVSAGVPLYPEAARAAGIAGRVVLDCMTSNGRVTSSTAMEGDRTLVAAAQAAVAAWQLAPGADARWTVEFVYALEKRPPCSDQKVLVVLDLPDRAEITAPYNGW